MRTSRIAQQTAHVIESLSPRRSLRTAASNLTARPSTPPNRQAAASESPLSSPPQTPQTARKIEISSTQTSTRKRKRGDEELSTSPVSQTVAQVSTSVTSPRKSGSNGRPRKAPRQPAKQIKGKNGEFKVEAPPNWEKMYDLTKSMRSEWQAPVDTMGCESLAEDKRSPRDRRFQTLIALMLSSQTKDTVTAVAMKNLQEQLPGGFTLESVRKVDPTALNGLINKVGFHNNKTKYIKAVVEILAEKHDSDIPGTIEGLVALPGVGPKMAYLCMSAAWGKDEGIGVDVHVHRITNLWGWHKTKDPEETRMMLESWLPREKWHDINHLLVGFGQTWCPPVGRKCAECKLAHESLCPSAVVAKSVQKHVKKEQITKKDETGDDTIRVEAIEMPIKAEELADTTTFGGSILSPDIEDTLSGPRRSSRRR